MPALRQAVSYIAGLVAHAGGFAQMHFTAVGIEIDIGHCGKQAFEHGPVNVRIACAELGCAMGVHGNSLGRIDQEILQGGGVRLFAAHAESGATGSLGSLFALVAKHGSVLWGMDKDWCMAAQAGRSNRTARY